VRTDRGRRPLELDFDLDLVSLDLYLDFGANTLGHMHAHDAGAERELDVTIGAEAR
jgi:hypothetical protein